MSISFSLSNFQGPLDLLLTLVKEKKMDLLALDIRELAKQYLEIVSSFKNRDIDEIAEYLVMASDLLEMKSKQIIPTPEEEGNPNASDEERDRLVSRLVLYKRYKDITLKFQEFEAKRKLIFTRPASEEEIFFEGIIEENLPDFADPSDIFEVMSDISSREESDHDIPHTIIVKELSAEDIESKILSYAQNHDRFTLTEYLASVDELQLSMQYLALTFLAVLTLARRQILYISQAQMYSEIYIQLTKDEDRDMR